MSELPYKNQQPFAFLAHPPPPKKRAGEPDAALPPTPPLKFAAILSWAATVQPGSPAPRSPDSPRARRSRSSFSSSTASPRRSRRPSIVSLLGSSAAAHTRTPSVADKFDLTAHGYTSVFVHIPETPTTPSPLLREYDLKHRAPAPSPALEPSALKRKGTMRRFRSLSILRPRTKQAKSESGAPASPTSPKFPKAFKTSKKTIASPATATTPGSASKAEICAASIAQRKRAKYAYVRPPPTLAQELAVMQFADGGKLETHIQRVMEEQARLAAGTRGAGTGGAGGGVGDVYRDERGGVWWDADEEMEYAHLLGGEVAQDALVGPAGDGDVEMGWEWEAFGDAAAEPLAPFLNFHASGSNSGFASSSRSRSIPHPLRTAPLPTSHTSPHPPPSPLDDRRSSISSLDSDLDPQYLLPLPENEDPRAAVDDRALASRRIGGPGMSVLSLPSRPRRAALHLAKPSAFLVGEAFRAPGSPPAPHLGDASGGEQEKENAVPTGETVAELGGRPKPRGKARRRPAPLKLASSAHAASAAAAGGAGGASRRRHHRAHSHAHGHTPSTPPARALPPVPIPVPIPVPAQLNAEEQARLRNAFIADSFAPLAPSLQGQVIEVPPSSLTARPTHVAYTAPPPMTPSRMAFKVKGLFAGLGIQRKASAAPMVVN